MGSSNTTRKVVEKPWAHRIVNKQTGTLVWLQVSSTWVALSSVRITLATHSLMVYCLPLHILFFFCSKRRLLLLYCFVLTLPTLLTRQFVLPDSSVNCLSRYHFLVLLSVHACVQHYISWLTGPEDMTVSCREQLTSPLLFQWNKILSHTREREGNPPKQVVVFDYDTEVSHAKCICHGHVSELRYNEEGHDKLEILLPDSMLNDGGYKL
jgi:hypothetical protein